MSGYVGTSCAPHWLNSLTIFSLNPPLPMKVTPFAVGVLFCFGAPITQAQINPGDIAIIQVNSVSDGFTWVALKDIAAAVTATDSSWGASGGQGWRTSENFHTALPASIAAGTIGFTAMGTALSTDGDQVFLYNKNGTNFTDSTTAMGAAFVFGINLDNPGWLTSGSYSPSRSYLPTTLVQHSLSLGTGDNWYYTGPVAGSSTQLLNLILDAGNWATSASTGLQFSALRPEVSSFTILETATASITAVPEPAAALWSFCALSGLGLLILKKHKQHGIGR